MQTTDLTELHANFRIEKGKAETSDLRLAGPLVRITGTGTTDLNAKTLSFRIEPKLVMTTQGQGSTVADPIGLGVPVDHGRTVERAAHLSGYGRHPRQSRRGLRESCASSARACSVPACSAAPAAGSRSAGPARSGKQADRRASARLIQGLGGGSGQRPGHRPGNHAAPQAAPPGQAPQAAQPVRHRRPRRRASSSRRRTRRPRSTASSVSCLDDDSGSTEDHRLHLHSIARSAALGAFRI